MSDFSRIREVIRAVSAVVIGKQHKVELAVACILAGGHLLIEDVPGVGKTTLAECLATVFGLEYRRVQFTADLMPADVTGSSVWDKETGQFRFLPGPVFSQVVLADEINRGLPRTQSALLEAMEEHKVSIDGVSRALPKPFFVIATQNPSAHQGTYPLPESQLDRFMMKLSLGYPSPSDEEALLLGAGGRRSGVEVMTSVMLLQAQAAVADIHVSPALARYVVALATQTRRGDFIEGLSPRGSLALVKAARSWAALQGATEVHPEHLQAVFLFVAGHRVRLRTGSGATEEVLAEILRTVPV